MPRFQREKSQSGYYHIMMRGNERKNIFLDEEDKLRFTEILYDKKKENEYELCAYCLMDNHVHILICEKESDIARNMKRIAVSYVSYFNKKYKRIGHLFQDRYKSENIENDSYLLMCARYIHQNPVKANIVEAAKDYVWSSYKGYVNENEPLSKALDRRTLLNLFSENNEKAKEWFVQFMNEESNEIFMDVEDEVSIVDKEEAKAIYKKLLAEYGTCCDGKEVKTNISDEFIKEFKGITGLSIRKIAVITGLNKDKICKILRQ